MKQGQPLVGQQEGLTKRMDAWWVGPAITFVVYSAFVIYATFRVFEGHSYVLEPYHSPFGSPDLRVLIPFALPAVISPALLLLPLPAGFRFTCYYYRKSYYRAFYGSPPGCSVKPWGAKSHGGKREYEGETGILAVQNLHRYFLYVAILIVFVLFFDAAISMWSGPYFTGDLRFGIGSAILWLNVFLLAGYTFGCHALRHLVGGKQDCFSCTKFQKRQHGWWKRVTNLNEKHAVWAWASLISVWLSDVYIRWVVIPLGGVEAIWWL